MPSTGLPGARGITEHIWGLGDPQKHAPPTQYDHPTERFLHVLRAEAVLPLPVPRHFLIVPSADHPISVALGHLPSRHLAPHSRVRGAAQSPSRPLVSCPRPPAEGGSTQGQAPCLLSQPGPPRTRPGCGRCLERRGDVQTLLPAVLPARPLVLRLALRQGGRAREGDPGLLLSKRQHRLVCLRKHQRERITCSEKNKQLASSLSLVAFQRGLLALIAPKRRKPSLKGRTEP